MGVLFSRAAFVALAAALLRAADPSVEDILRRLERLEKENQALRDEVRELRSRLDAGGTPIEERLTVQERRTDEQQQTKVESSARVPIRLTGMLLFNLYS